LNYQGKFLLCDPHLRPRLTVFHFVKSSILPQEYLLPRMTALANMDDIGNRQIQKAPSGVSHHLYPSPGSTTTAALPLGRVLHGAGAILR